MLTQIPHPYLAGRMWAALACLLFSCCQKQAVGDAQVTIGEIVMTPPVVRTGQGAVLSVPVKNPGGRKLDFTWGCTRGTIARAETPAAAKYTAPAEPSTVQITLDVSSKGVVLANKELYLVVDRAGPIDVMTDFVLSGWMGDCESGPPACTMDDGWRMNPHSPPGCLRITYRQGRAGWGGMYYLWGDGNWGDRPGRDLRGYRRLIFWAKADSEALIEFKAGGVNAAGKPHRDSFMRSLGTQPVGKVWRQYTIDLGGADLSSVIGGFAWAAKSVSNPGGLMLYLDDIRYEE